MVVGPHAISRLHQLTATRADEDVISVVITLDPALVKGLSLCSSSDPDVAKTFALYRRVPVPQLDGTEFLIDASNLIRSMWYPGVQPDWTDPVAFHDEVVRVRETPAKTGRFLAPHAHMH